jgi:hypothetical protein
MMLASNIIDKRADFLGRQQQVVVIVAGIHGRTSDTSGVVVNAKTNGVVVKAGKPAVLSTRDDSTIR